MEQPHQKSWKKIALNARTAGTFVDDTTIQDSIFGEPLEGKVDSIPMGNLRSAAIQNSQFLSNRNAEKNPLLDLDVIT